MRHLTERLPVMVGPVARHPRPADRRGRRAGLPHRRRLDLPPGREPHLRGRRHGRGELRRPDPGVRPGSGVCCGVWLISVPVLTPWLSSHWVEPGDPGATAPSPAPLIDSLRARGGLPRAGHRSSTCPTRPRGCIGYDRAVALALAKINTGDVETRWSDAAGTGAAARPAAQRPAVGGRQRVHRRARARRAPPAPRRCGRVVDRHRRRDRGWYSFPLAWAARGVLDRLFGGFRAAPRPAQSP